MLQILHSEKAAWAEMLSVVWTEGEDGFLVVDFFIDDSEEEELLVCLFDVIASAREAEMVLLRGGRPRRF